MSAATIKDEALNLSVAERAQLIDALWDSLATSEMKARENAWAAESERRIDAFEAGKLKARDAQAIFSELRDRFKK
jgi:putative addiction module component (TIGR02574 family)